MTTIGLIGAGHIGSTVAKTAIAHGYSAVISNARGPASLGDLVGEIGGGIEAVTIEEAVNRADIVLIAVPFKNYSTLDPEPFAGKLVIDANNYFPQRDGPNKPLDDHEMTSSELVQAHFSRATVVKAFNSIDAAELITDAKPSSDANRRAMALCGNDATAKKTVSKFIDDIGFDAVDIGDLDQGWRFGPESLVFVQHLNAVQVREKAEESKI
jgi:predicted dinucleotide-binding enzyme